MHVAQKDYLTTVEACEYMGIGRTYFLQCCKKYKIPCGQLGRTNIYRKKDLQRVLEQKAFKTVTTRS